jgi:hypothetical protein
LAGRSSDLSGRKPTELANPAPAGGWRLARRAQAATSISNKWHGLWAWALPAAGRAALITQYRPVPRAAHPHPHPHPRPHPHRHRHRAPTPTPHTHTHTHTTHHRRAPSPGTGARRSPRLGAGGWGLGAGGPPRGRESGGRGVGAATARFLIRLAAWLPAAIARSSPLPGLGPGAKLPIPKAKSACTKSQHIFLSSALAVLLSGPPYLRMAIVPPIRTFFSLTRRVVVDTYHIYRMQQFLYWQIRISVRYTGPHLATAPRTLC